MKANLGPSTKRTRSDNDRHAATHAVNKAAVDAAGTLVVDILNGLDGRTTVDRVCPQKNVASGNSVKKQERVEAVEV